jgi:putative SOS response-associated peptidase YedK
MLECSMRHKRWHVRTLRVVAGNKAKRRARVPADGYYEWLEDPDGSKTPIYLHPEDEGALLGFAALYEFCDKAVGDVRNDGPHLIEPVGKE